LSFWDFVQLSAIVLFISSSPLSYSSFIMFISDAPGSSPVFSIGADAPAPSFLAFCLKSLHHYFPAFFSSSVMLLLLTFSLHAPGSISPFSGPTLSRRCLPATGYYSSLKSIELSVNSQSISCLSCLPIPSTPDVKYTLHSVTIVILFLLDKITLLLPAILSELFVYQMLLLDD
jgi:hypothetical protein